MIAKRITIFKKRLSKEDAETYARRIASKWECVIVRITPHRIASFDYTKG